MSKIVSPTSESLKKAARLLLKGELVAMPTETVYGLAADATNDKAIAKIYSLKNRPSFNPLIIHFSGVSEIKAYAEWNDRAERLAALFWPGPLTLVLRKKPSSLSLLATAGLDTVGVRIPRHETARLLIQEAGKPLAAPSANPSEAISPTSAQDVRDSFPAETSLLILEGNSSQGGIESTILDLTEDVPVLLRPGLVSREDLEEALQCKIITPDEDVFAFKSPGQMKRHYAPHLPLRINVTDIHAKEALLAFGSSPLKGGASCLNLSPEGHLEEAAANLFRMMRALDQPCFSGIAVMPIPCQGIGVALNDRLKRAAS